MAENLRIMREGERSRETLGVEDDDGFSMDELNGSGEDFQPSTLNPQPSTENSDALAILGELNAV